MLLAIHNVESMLRNGVKLASVNRIVGSQLPIVAGVSSNVATTVFSAGCGASEQHIGITKERPVAVSILNGIVGDIVVLSGERQTLRVHRVVVANAVGMLARAMSP